MSNIEIRGTRELSRAFRTMSAELKLEAKAELRVAARGVADEAKNIATAKGLVATGALRSRIKPSVRGGMAFVRETAATPSAGYPAGYPYPRVYEFGHGGARAFLRPALEAKSPEITLGFERLIERLSLKNGII